MSDLVRFGIAIDQELLERFDARVAAKGYENRSEAIRDLIRADLVEQVDDPHAQVTGTLTLVYDHHVRELSERLTDIQHELGHHVVSALHVHLDHDHCLEVVVMRGEASLLRNAADRITAEKGVMHGRLTLTGVPVPEASRADFHGPADHAHGPHGGHTHVVGTPRLTGRPSAGAEKGAHEHGRRKR
ncbi:MAG: nickel-responsive transcriptional regulator NikR [Myxococcales bacterium]|nr:nickel-responsive transcriptional regulator NikR [Myxococcales bacterium]